jgi:hypothetical protein
MGGPSRRRIFGDRVSGAKISAQHARERAKEAVREADAAECLLWSEQMEGFGGPAQPSPTIAQCLNGGYGWLEVQCKRCETRASIPLDAIRRPRDTPIWKLEAALKCGSVVVSPEMITSFFRWPWSLGRCDQFWLRSAVELASRPQ